MITVTLEVSQESVTSGKDPVVAVTASIASAIARETTLTVHRIDVEESS